MKDKFPATRGRVNMFRDALKANIPVVKLWTVTHNWRLRRIAFVILSLLLLWPLYLSPYQYQSMVGIAVGGLLSLLLATAVSMFDTNRWRLFVAAWLTLIPSLVLTYDKLLLPTSFRSGGIDQSRVEIGFEKGTNFDGVKIIMSPQVRMILSTGSSRSGFVEMTGRTGNREIVAIIELPTKARVKRPAIKYFKAPVFYPALAEDARHDDRVTLHTVGLSSFAKIPIRPNLQFHLNLPFTWRDDLLQTPAIGIALQRAKLSVPIKGVDFEKAIPPPDEWPRPRLSIIPASGLLTIDETLPSPSEMLDFNIPAWSLPPHEFETEVSVRVSNQSLRFLVEILVDLLFVAGGFFLGSLNWVREEQ